MQILRVDMLRENLWRVFRGQLLLYLVLRWPGVEFNGVLLFLVSTIDEWFEEQVYGYPR